MKKQLAGLVWASLVVFAFAASACAVAQTPVPPDTATPAPGAASSSTTYSDPFTYCAAVGTIDQPDARYRGPKIPDPVIKGYLKAAGLENTTEPADMLQKSTIWRCMDQQVYACNFGANLPCDSKADVNKTPTPGMADYCKQNPGSDFIPMSVTGHATVYSWRCAKDAPQAADQIEKVDAAGYLAGIWYPIQPGP
jgi:hypothetical protein